VAEAVYELREDGVFATGFSRGPWDPGAQHGGAPAAVLMRAFEACEPDPALAIARVTYELLRPVPLGELRLDADIVRPGRRVQLLEGKLSTPDGLEVVRARALRVARADVDAGPRTPPPSGPEHGEPNQFVRGDLELFPTDAMEIRFVSGQFYDPGPATAWFRLRVPIVAGEEPSGRQRLAAAADFPNGIGSALSWQDYVFINPDLTVYIEREPVGEWICLDARMTVVSGGIGFSEAVLYDSSGRVGRSLQSLYVARR
jgi:Thioesterase-like superfamily